MIAAINGAALGAGLAVAASCDILYCANEAVLGLPEIDVGLLGGGKHSQRLFPHSTLRRMMLTGYRVPGPELFRLGVVEASVPRAELMATVMVVARQIAGKSPAAIRLAKRTLNTIEDMSLRDGYRYEQNMTTELGDHPDSAEAQAAFREKRQPEFSRGMRTAFRTLTEVAQISVSQGPSERCALLRRSRCDLLGANKQEIGRKRECASSGVRTWRRA